MTETKEDVTLIGREPEDNLPAMVSVDIFKPRENRKGLRTRYEITDNAYTYEQQRLLYYKLWRTHPWIKSFANKAAKLGTIVGWMIRYIGEGPEDEKRKKLINNFFEYPNYQMSFKDIIFKTILQLKLFSTSWWEVVFDSKRNPIDFYPLDGWVKANIDTHGNPQQPAYTQRIVSLEANFDYNEVIWFRFQDPLGCLYPPSDLEALELTTLLDVNAMNLNKRKQTQGVRKGKLFIFPSGMSPEEMKRNRAEVHGTATGVEGSFSPMLVLEGDLKVQDLEMNEQDMEQKELRIYNRDEMSAVIGTPLSKFGINGVPSTEGEFVTKTFFDEEIKPILDIIQDTINRYLDLIGIFDYRFEFKPYPTRDLKETARLIDVLSKRGVVSANEIRGMVGLPAIPGGDTFYYELKDGRIIETGKINEEFGKVPLPPVGGFPMSMNNGGTFSFQPGSRRVLKKSNATLELEEGEHNKEEEGEVVHPFQ